MMMRIAAILLLTLATAGAQMNVVFPWVNSANGRQQVRRMELFPIAVNGTGPNGLTTLDRISKTTDMTGSVLFTNLLPGSYMAVFYGNTICTTQWFSFSPFTNGTVNATNYVTGTNTPPLVVGFSLSASNATTAQTLAGTNGATVTPANGGFVVSPLYQSFPLPGFINRPVGIASGTYPSLNDLFGNTILLTGSNQTFTVRDTNGNDIAYFSTTNSGSKPHLATAPGGIFDGGGGGLTNLNARWEVNIANPPFNALPGTDITVALSNAVNLPYGHTVYIPFGDFSQGLIVCTQPNVTIEGPALPRFVGNNVGDNGANLYATGSAGLFYVPGTNSMGGITIRNLRLHGSGSATNLIRYSAGFCDVQDCALDDTYPTGGNPAIIIDNPVVTQATVAQNNILRCEIDLCGEGIRLQGAQQSEISQCFIQQNYGSGIVFTNDVDDIRVQGNNIFLNGWAGIQVDGGRECVIADNLISNNYTNNIRAVGWSSGFNIERNWFEDPGVYQNPVVHWSIQTEYGNVGGGGFGFSNPWPYNWHFSGNYYSIGAPRFAIRLDGGSGFTFVNEMINQGYLLSSASVSNFMISASVSNVFSFNLAGEGGYAVLPANLSIQTWGTNLTVWDIRMLGGLTINGSVTFGNPITLLSDLAIAGRLFATNGCGLWGNVGVGKYPATTTLDVNGNILASGAIGINTNGLSHSLEVLGTVHASELVIDSVAIFGSGNNSMIGNAESLTNLYPTFGGVATNSYGSTVKGQLPVIVNGVPYYVDLKQ